MKKLLAKLFILTSVVGLLGKASPVKAQFEPGYETFRLPYSAFYLPAGKTQSLKLDGWHYVKKIIIRAQSASAYDAKVQVWANGDVKGTVYLPGVDPSYVVTVAASVRSIEFQAVLNSAWIQEVHVVGTRHPNPYFDEGLPEFPNLGWDHSSRNEVAAVSQHIIRVVDRLERYTNYKDYGDFLLPIKKAAAKSYALAQAGSVLSPRLREAVIALIAQIDYANDFLNQAYEVEAAFELVVSLKASEERLRRMLH